MSPPAVSPAPIFRERANPDDLESKSTLTTSPVSSRTSSPNPMSSSWTTSVPVPVTPDAKPQTIISTPALSNVNMNDKSPHNSPKPLLSSRPPVITNRSRTASHATAKQRQTLQETLIESTAVQRLVEYFLVVSSKPRWETTRQPKNADLNEMRKPQTVTSEMSPTRSACSPPLKSRIRLRSRRDPQQRDDQTSDSGSNLEEDDSEQEFEAREQVSPPTPRSEWTREEAGTENNVRMPATGLEHTFQPKITARFPPVDHDDNPLNPMIVQFCYPSGDVIVPSRVYELPRVHHFVLTNEKGRKVYGTCLTIFEEYHPSAETPWRSDQIHSDDGERDIEVTVGNHGAVLYIPRVLCLLSTWPYLTAFREYLSQIFRLATTTNVMTTPIERYVLNLCMEIPAPPPGAYEVQVSILDSTIRFWAPPAKLPIAYVALPYGTLFDCLDVENILLLWNALIMEHKILLVSGQYSLLTICAEILCSLLFPMRWCHLYVPLLPRFLCPMLDAPVPYLCGVTRENWLFAQQHISTETIVVDLDRNTVAFGEATPELTPAPGKKWGKLHAAVEQAAGHLFWRTRGLEDDYRTLHGRKPLSRRNLARLQRKGADGWKEKLQTYDQAFNLAFTPDSPNLLNDKSPETQQSQWDRVQEAFLRFFVALFKDYRKFLRKPDANTPGSFDREAFIASQKPENQYFLFDLSMTQHFDDYMTKRLYSPGEPDVIFFDQSIDAKLNRSRLKLKKVDTPFLQSAKAHKVLKKFQAVQPNAQGLCEPGKAYVYHVWPETFNQIFFSKPRPIPKMIAAEFDRQQVLVSRLRAQYTFDEESDQDFHEFYGKDCGDLPEGGAFTVFFFTYSALIGRDWLKYQKKRRESHPENQDYNFHLNETIIPQPEQSTAIIAHQSPCIEITTEDCGPLELCQTCSDDGFSKLKSTLYMVTPQVFNFQRKPSSAHFSAPNPNRSMSLVDFDDSYFAEYEEARAVAGAQLDLAFETLSTMTMRGLSTDVDAYKSLMEACGRCGDTHRVLELIELMRRDGLCVDGEVLSCFISAFAHQEDGSGTYHLSPSKQYFGCDAYYSYLQKKLDMHEQSRGHNTTSTPLSGLIPSDDEAFSDFMSDTSGLTDFSEHTESTYGSAILEWLSTSASTTQKKPKTKRKRKGKRKSRRDSSICKPDMPVTDAVQKQNNLAENLLEFLYPGLTIDTESDSCPLCSNTLMEDDVVAGWLPCAFQDFTTCCPKCKHRFVPRFIVTCLSPDFQGSQGQGTPLYCEFLSPWVLRKEIRHVTKGSEGIEEMLNPEWRSGSDIRGTLWWNMIVLCKRYKLPFSFLLQGSFHNRLINPTPDTA